MSTRSLIGVLEDTGSIRFIYCHSDGYPEHNGAMLLDHHNSRDAALAIVALGDASFLDKTIKKSKFYTRDRGEEAEQTMARTADSLADFLKTNAGTRYWYWYTPDGWMVCDGSHSPIPVWQVLGRDPPAGPLASLSAAFEMIPNAGRKAAISFLAARFKIALEDVTS